MGRSGFSEHRDDVIDFDYEQTIIAFEIDGYGVFGIEQDLVVSTQWYIRCVFDFNGDCDDSPGYRWNFYIVRQLDTAFGLLLVLIFVNQDTFAYRLDRFERL